MNRKYDEIPILKHDLKALLFWAAYGIEKAITGSYRDAAGENGIVDSYAKSINFYLKAPEFQAKWRKASSQ